MRGIGTENGETRRNELASETEPVEYDFRAHRSSIREIIGAWLAAVVVLLLLAFA